MIADQIHAFNLDEIPGRLAAIRFAHEADLALAFGAPDLVKDRRLFNVVRTTCPQAQILGCSTAGEITRDGIAEGSVVLTLARFERVDLEAASTGLAGMRDSEGAGRRLGDALARPDLRAVLLFGQGVHINGSALIGGLRDAVGSGVAITGGLAGDGARFGETVVLTPDGPSTSAVAALGLYGDALRLNHGSFGGWEPFGPLRKVTRSEGNVLFELDGKPALDMYKRYLGPYASELPSSGLLFPFEMIDRDRGTTGVIRTILGIDGAAGSLILAGDIDPEGYLQLMHANADRLIDGAASAALAANDRSPNPGQNLGLLVSCVGRKLVMGERIDEEIEAVANVFGTNTLIAGFYSYGEISPSNTGTDCRLHNQTMTVTWIAEAG